MFYYKIKPNGLIIQWGRYYDSNNIGDNGYRDITYPITFSSGCTPSIIASLIYSATDFGDRSFIINEITYSNNTKFRFRNGADTVQGFYWHALGY